MNREQADCVAGERVDVLIFERYPPSPAECMGSADSTFGPACRVRFDKPPG